MKGNEIFVSYTSLNEDIAEWIAWILEDSGHSVLIQKWDFRPGNNFVLRMQEAASKAQKTIAVLSKAYEESSFVHPEWAAEFVDDPIGTNRRLIPVRVEDYSPKGVFRSIVYIDLVDCLKAGDGEEARRRLIEGINVSRIKPDSEPSFPACN